MGITRAIFKRFRKYFLFQKRDVGIVLSNTFKRFVGIQLGPAGFSRCNVILKTTLLWVLLVSQKTFFQEDCQGSLIVFYLFVHCCFLFFSNCGKKLLQVIAYSTSSSHHLLEDSLCLFFLFIYIYNRLILFQV